MTSDAKEQIRQRLDIAEVVGEQVALKPAGRGQLKGLCPFHNEKTPSFHVHAERGFFYCFGCGAKGDLFDFVMRVQGVSFPEALQLLGRRAGVEVTPPSAQDRKHHDLYEVNALALSFFRDGLEGEAGKAALQYLRDRGLSPASIEGFRLGFAPDSWDALLRHALGKGVRESDLVDAGLVTESEGGRRYDRFRNRVIFPIEDHLGRVVGFAGRVLDDSLPKYLNTPETELFRKGELLYGLHQARSAIREGGECIVVEGYMDVIALHQTGFGNAVAALGATLTTGQADLLSRLDVQRLYLAFDADAAGQRAVLAGLDQSVGRQFLVRAVQVPYGKDPADAVLGGHAEEFRRALGQGLSEVEFRFRSTLAKHDANTLQGRRAILNELLPVLRPRDVFDPVAQEMKRLVVDELGVDEARLDAWISSRRERRLDDVQVRGMERSRGGVSQLAKIELEVIALLLLEPARLRQRLRTAVSALPPAPDSRLREFYDLCEQQGYDDRGVLERYRERDEGRLLFERLFAHGGDEGLVDIDGHIDKALSRLRELYLDGEKEQQRRRLLERMAQLEARLADPALPPGVLQELYGELKELGSMLAARDAERRIRMPAALARGRRRGG